MTPARYVIDKFGGVRATARAIGITPGSVCLWNRPVHKSKRGLGGRIPETSIIRILTAAKKMGLNIKAKDLIQKRKTKTN